MTVARVTNGQSGQVLVGALVCMTFVFVFAGGIAVATSALLSSETNAAVSAGADLNYQSGLAAAASYVYGSGSGVSAPRCPGQVTLPALGASGELAGIQCRQIDNLSVVPPSVLPLLWQSRTCAVTPLPALSQRTLIWLAGGNPLNAYVDPTSSGCGGGSSAVCASASTLPVAVAVLDCQFSGSPGLFLHASVGSHAPFAARYAPYSAPFVQTPQSPYTVGAGPTFLVARDLRGAGVLDLVAVDTGGAQVSVLLGDGKGGFAPASNYAVGLSPQAVAVADFNGDGVADLAVSNYDSDTISVLLGRGDGTFGAKTDIAVGHRPGTVVAADFNRDGNVDLAVAGTGPSDVEVLLGHGDGTFSNGPGPFKVANSPNDLATADFNRDGVPDLIAAGAAKTMSVLLGAGDGSFTAAPTPPSVGGGVSGLEIADLNNDGKTDVVVVNAATSNASILLGAGNGTFSVAPGSPLAVAGGAVEGAVGDLTSDGIPDLVVGQASGQSMTAYAGNGDGSFRALAGTPIGLGSADADVAVGDFDGRNGPDLAAVTQNSKLSVWLQNRARDSVFAIAAPAGYGYEEGDLTVKADGTSTALTYEAGL